MCSWDIWVEILAVPHKLCVLEKPFSCKIKVASQLLHGLNEIVEKLAHTVVGTQ